MQQASTLACPDWAGRGQALITDVSQRCTVEQKDGEKGSQERVSVLAGGWELPDRQGWGTSSV